jgi:hypothetical protein
MIAAAAVVQFVFVSYTFPLSDLLSEKLLYIVGDFRGTGIGDRGGPRKHPTQPVRSDRKSHDASGDITRGCADYAAT